jgi:dihydroflavonol-4-reductase
MRILLTGASGFIGSRVCAALAAEGGQVRAFCRSEPPAWAKAADWVRGDVTDRAALARGLTGCEAAVHVAAIYSYARSDAPLMHAVNVEGTRNLVRESISAGVRRVLITSSSCTCGPVPGRPATERDAPPAWELAVPYKATKLAAERLALAAGGGGTDVLCVNPTTVVGAGDARPTPSGRMIRDLLRRPINAYLPGGGINAVSVDDVARGHALALAHGHAGERYILGGEDLALREAFAIVLAEVGRPPPRCPLPWSVVYAVALAAEVSSRAVGREPRLIVRDEVRLSRIPLYFSSEKARRTLGYSPAPAAIALADAARWFARLHAEQVGRGPALVPVH